jgi:hypothetical protein
VLLRCVTCHRPGLAWVACDETVAAGRLLEFHPHEGFPAAKLPEDLPDDVKNEFREAELCASARAWRAGSALLRSSLEKLLIANGYASGALAAKIDQAAVDGVITESRKRSAHTEVRVLGNDILHDPWKPVSEDDFMASHHYTHRVIEDLYDERAVVEQILINKGRLRPNDETPPEGGATSAESSVATEDSIAKRAPD